jgi:hypothetical protein
MRRHRPYPGPAFREDTGEAQRVRAQFNSVWNTSANAIRGAPDNGPGAAKTAAELSLYEALSGPLDAFVPRMLVSTRPSDPLTGLVPWEVGRLADDVR